MTEIIITPSLFATIAFVFWVLVSELGRRSRAKMVMEFRSRLLDRLTSASDIAAVLQNEEGVRLLSGVEETLQSGIHRGVLNSVQIGVLLIFIAAGLATLAMLDSFQSREIFTALGIMFLFAGMGFLISAFVSWRLGLRSGLVQLRDGR